MIKINKSCKLNKTLVLKVISLFLIAFFLSVYLHELIHYIIAIIDPACNPIGFHVFDSYALNKGYWGCIPLKGDVTLINLVDQEYICYGSQLIFIILFPLITIKKIGGH